MGNSPPGRHLAQSAGFERGFNPNTHSPLRLFPQPPAPFRARCAARRPPTAVAARDPDSPGGQVMASITCPMLRSRTKSASGTAPTPACCALAKRRPASRHPPTHVNGQADQLSACASSLARDILGAMPASFLAGTRSLLSGHCAVPCACVRIYPFSQSHPLFLQTRIHASLRNGGVDGQVVPTRAQIDARGRNGPCRQARSAGLTRNLTLFSDYSTRSVQSKKSPNSARRMPRYLTKSCAVPANRH